MILLDKPYVSDFLKRTIAEHRLPVIGTAQAAQFGLNGAAVVIPPEAAIEQFRTGAARLLYANSENAINWIAHNLPFTDLPRQIQRLKDKAAFRRLLEPLFPDFYYRAVEIGALAAIDPATLPLPCIIKPAIGFFSMGVRKVSRPEEWPGVVRAIQAEMAAVQALYPAEVLDTTQFLIEECIEGEELAIDLYFNQAGQPVILNILHHIFSSDTDVSDRVYITAKPIILRYRERLNALLAEIGRLAGLRGFPVHAEVRIDAQGRIRPIEVNPLRFGGWCATDIAWHAYQINPYRYYFEQREPDWDTILAARGDEIFGLVVLDSPADVPAAQIAAFDYAAVLAQFEKPLELRQIDYTEYPVFGFVFVEIRPGHLAELDPILRSDLKEFIRRR